MDGTKENLILDMTPIKHEARKGETMRIKLNKDWTGCLDGIHPTTLPAGQVADVPLAIGQTLIADGRADVPPELKMESKPLENKMELRPLENKKRGRR